ncbi:copper amine oxidase, partial [Escherichia sp. TWPC-MK]
VKPGAQTAIVNGQSLALHVPVVMKDNKVWVSDTFINDVFQSGLDQTFQVEKRPHPLNALTADEIKQAVEIVKASADFKPNTRFTEISLLPPDKEAVWAFALENKPVDQPRKADVIMLDGKHIIEAVVDLQNNKLLSSNTIPWASLMGCQESSLLFCRSTTITGDMIHWRNWDFHLSMNSRVGPMISTVTYNDNGTKRKVMYEGSLGGMIVPYGDPDIGWYFKAYLDSGDYGMGTLTSPIARGKDAPSNAVLLNETIADYTGV